MSPAAVQGASTHGAAAMLRDEAHQQRRQAGTGRGVMLVALAFFVVMVGTTLPTPLYPSYQARFGFSQLLITVIFGVYAISVMISLMLLGRLSDFIGRRRVLIPGVVLSAVSAALFLVANGLVPILAGRVVSGVSAALFTGTGTAALVDMFPQDQHGRATVVAVAANLGGLGFGQLLSGVVADHVTRPLQVPYAIDVGMCLVAFVGLLLQPARPQQRGHWHPQRFTVPAEVRPAFVPAAVAGVGGFAVFGLYGAVVPGFLVHQLHAGDATLVGVVVFALMITAAAGQIVTARLHTKVALMLGAIALIAGTVLTGVSVALNALVPLFAATPIIGAGQGLVIGAGLASINQLVPVEQRGEVASNYFVLLYAGLALPVIGVGLLSEAVGIRVATLALTAVVTLAVAAVILFLMGRAVTAEAGVARN